MSVYLLLVWGKLICLGEPIEHIHHVSHTDVAIEELETEGKEKLICHDVTICFIESSDIEVAVAVISDCYTAYERKLLHSSNDGILSDAERDV